MRWDRSAQSANIEDRRGMGMGGGMRLGLGGTVLLAVLGLVFGRDFLGEATQGTSSTSGPAPRTAPPPGQDELVHFVSFVLDDTQATWAKAFAARGKTYEDAKLVLFTNAVRSGCGTAGTEVGPFYCPADRKVYIDLAFYDELKRRFGAPGDFAQAYVIAHEIGHHVQNQLGISDQVSRAEHASPGRANALSVRLELQADCLAGVWGHSTEQRNILEQGDVEEGLGAAAAVGDDRLQRQATGHVSPETWTHGSSQQRVAWFKKGLTEGRIESCDTFKTPEP